MSAALQTKARNRYGRYMSKLDVYLAEQEAIWNSEIKEKMDAGMTFNEAWIASGGEIIATTGTTPDDADEIRSAYAAVGRKQP